MGIELPDVHVLVQDLDGDRVQRWREPAGPDSTRVVMERRLPRRRAVWIARH